MLALLSLILTIFFCQSQLRPNHASGNHCQCKHSDHGPGGCPAQVKGKETICQECELGLHQAAHV